MFLKTFFIIKLLAQINIFKYTNIAKIDIILGYLIETIPTVEVNISLD